jgi:hypothetical protein
VSWKERVELRATFMANVNDPSAKSKDSDWDDDGQLIAYSESDSALDARAVDASLLYTLIQKTTAGGSAWALRGGAGLAYQTFDWKDGKTWQVDEGGLSFFEGALTYKSDVTMPCAMVAGSYHSGSVGIRLEAGAGPVFVRDEDDHVLREIRAEADMTGTGFRGLAEIRWDATKRIYLLARASTLTARVDGTSKNLVYGPGVDGENDGLIGDTWKIDEKYSINSTTYSLVVGLNF